MAIVTGWSNVERCILARLNTPAKVQRFLDDEIAYNLEPGGATCLSARSALNQRRAHCMEGALLAAAALDFHGDPPLLVDLESVRDDDHVLAVYRRRGLWGALAKSNYSGLRSRQPVYRTLRELAMSYFEHYYNPRGEKTLRGYSRPVALARFGSRWALAEGDVWFVPEYLCEISHTKILDKAAELKLDRMDRRLFDAGRFGMAK